MSPAQDSTYPLFSIFAFLGFVLSLIPLAWHIQAWNSGTCAFIIWTAMSCLVGFVNSIVWSGNLDNPAPVWCDISSKIIIGVSVGIPASILCISRRLYYLTSGNVGSLTRADKRRMIVVDICIAAGVPVIIMVLHYVVQGHRFDILEDVGCYPVVYNTLPAYFIYFMWPVVLGIISFCFSVMTLRSFWIRRVQFSQLLSSNSSMSMSRYLRLVMLAMIDMMCTTPFGVYSIYIGNLGVKLAPWVSWEETHYNFSYVGLIPSLVWRRDPSFRTSVELTRWLPVLCALLFFVLFGFALEARKFYKKVFQVVMKVLGVCPYFRFEKQAAKGLVTWSKASKDSSNLPTSTSIDTLPVYNAKFPDSPTTFNTTAKRPYRSFSLSTTTTTHGGVELELPPHPNQSFDIEKYAGQCQYRLSLPPFSPLDSDISTLCNNPDVKEVSKSQRSSIPCRPPSRMQEEVQGIPLPSPWSFGPSNHDEPVSSFVVMDGEEEEDRTASGIIQPEVPTPPQDAAQPRSTPTTKTSNSSVSTILAPERDRFYIVATDRSRSPSSPAPFSNTSSRSSSREDFREDVEVMQSDEEESMSGSSAVRMIEVVVTTRVDEH